MINFFVMELGMNFYDLIKETFRMNDRVRYSNHSFYGSRCVFSVYRGGKTCNFTSVCIMCGILCLMGGVH